MVNEDGKKIIYYLRFLHKTHVAVEPSRGPRRHDGDLGLVGEGTGHLQEAGLIFLDDLVGLVRWVLNRWGSDITCFVEHLSLEYEIHL